MALAYAYIALYFVVAQNTIEGLIEYIEKSDVTRIEKKRRPQLFRTLYSQISPANQVRIDFCKLNKAIERLSVILNIFG